MKKVDTRELSWKERVEIARKTLSKETFYEYGNLSPFTTPIITYWLNQHNIPKRAKDNNNNNKQIKQSMHYEIVIPIEIKDNYYNFGIDFWTQQITATNKVINKDEVIVNLKQLGLRLDNKVIKNYNIVKQKYEIRIWIECIQ